MAPSAVPFEPSYIAKNLRKKIQKQESFFYDPLLRSTVMSPGLFPTHRLPLLISCSYRLMSGYHSCTRDYFLSTGCPCTDRKKGMRTLSIECGSRASIYTRERCRK